ERSLQVVQSNKSLAVAANSLDVDAAVILQCPQWPKDRVVFRHGGDDTVLRSQQAMDGDVKRLCAAAGKYDSGRILCAEKRGDEPPRSCYERIGLQALRVGAAAGRRAVLTLIAIHGLVNLL